MEGICRYNTYWGNQRDTFVKIGIILFFHIDSCEFNVQGSVAEWSKALVLGTSHFGGVGSNPTTIRSFSLFLQTTCTFTLSNYQSSYKQYRYVTCQDSVAEWSKALV